MRRVHLRIISIIALATALIAGVAGGQDARGVGLSFEFGLDLPHPPLSWLPHSEFGLGLPHPPIESARQALVPGDTASMVAAGGHAGSAPAAEDSAAVSKAVPPVRIEETGIRFGARELREPVGIAADPRGFVYVADAMAGKVFRYELLRETGAATSKAPGGIAGIGPALEFSRPPDVASFYPIDVVVQESFVLILDYARNRLLRYDYRGAYYDVLVSFADRGRMRPVSVTAGSGGRFVTTDVEANAVVLWTPLLDIELELRGFGAAPGSFGAPRKAAFLPDQRFVVIESGNARLQEFSPSGRFERIVKPPGGFEGPRSVAADARGAVFVCDPEASRLAVFSPDLAHVRDIDRFGGTLIRPAAACVGWDGNLYVADLASRSIVVYRIVYPESP